MVTHRTSSSRSTARLRAAIARFGASSSSLGGTRSSSSARSYWPSTRCESTPVNAPTWAPSRNPEAERSGPDSGPAERPRRCARSASPASGRMLFRLAAIQPGRSTVSSAGSARRERQSAVGAHAPSEVVCERLDRRRRAHPRTAVSRRRALQSVGPRPNRLPALLERSPPRRVVPAGQPSRARAAAGRSHSYSRFVPISRIAPAPWGEPSDGDAPPRATAFLERAEVRDVLAWMRLLVDPQDAAAVVRALARPPIDMRQVDLARVIQVARRRKLDLVAGLTAATESPQVPPEARERIQRFVELHSSSVSELDTVPGDVFIARMIERLGGRGRPLLAPERGGRAASQPRSAARAGRRIRALQATIDSPRDGSSSGGDGGRGAPGESRGGLVRGLRAGGSAGRVAVRATGGRGPTWRRGPTSRRGPDHRLRARGDTSSDARGGACERRANRWTSGRAAAGHRP